VLAGACLFSYWVITSLLVRVHSVSNADDLLGGMWAVIATAFVYRLSSRESHGAALTRMSATVLSFALCLVYLLVVPFHPWGLALLIGVGAVVLSLLGRADDIVTCSITTAVVLVVAALSPHERLAAAHFASRRHRRRRRDRSGRRLDGGAPQRGGCAMSTTVPSVNDSSVLRLLPLQLSLIAGSADVVGFLWHGTFVAHITGNLILVAARVVAGTPVGAATVLSVPVFVVTLGLNNTAAVRLESAGIPSLRPLLGVQFVFLAGFFTMGTVAGTHGSPNSVVAVIALMLGVCGLATQNVLVQASIRGAPSTAVMTTNLTRFMYDLSELVLGTDSRSTGAARERVTRTWPAITGFAGGAAAGAALYAGVGVESLALPAGLALMAIGFTGRLQTNPAGRLGVDARKVVPGSLRGVPSRLEPRRSASRRSQVVAPNSSATEESPETVQ